MKNNIGVAFYGINDYKKLQSGLQIVLDSIVDQRGAYCGDNLFTYNKNLGFLDDDLFMKAVGRHISNEFERALIWRMATVLWGFRQGMRLDGDFVECACYKGVTAQIICDTVNFSEHLDRTYYLYDLFEHDPSMPHHSMNEHSTELYQLVKNKFLHLPNVKVTLGRVPQILAEVSPEKIAFLHLDMNNAEAEIGALDVLFERMVPGAVLILDDYGWLAYREQKIAEDDWFRKRGYHVLELPTGQGMVIR